MKIILLSFALFSFTSCATVNRSQVSAGLNPTIETKLKADITVDMNKKLKGVASGTTLFGILEISGPDHFADGVFASSSNFLGMGSGVSSLQAAAAYNAVKSGNADVIVNPQYVIEKKSYILYSKTTVMVTGYAGTINKIE
ncbi:MAG: hypothetical protein EOP11_26175 [Proteobacteria bacterium]|nr:MAG: hypothetical protein EOP11_26175 [Pseudomonadota bacterium]